MAPTPGPAPTGARLARPALRALAALGTKILCVSVLCLTGLVAGCGTVDDDSPSVVGSVTTSASTSPAPAAAGTAEETALAFAALRDGGSPAAVPWAARVTYVLGAEPLGELSAEELPESLRDCPPRATELEGRSCPVSPLDSLQALADADLEPVVEQGVPQDVGCNRYPPPTGTEGWQAVSLRPPVDHRSCFEDFAISLYLDGEGAVTMIRYALSGP